MLVSFPGPHASVLGTRLRYMYGIQTHTALAIDTIIMSTYKNDF